MENLIMGNSMKLNEKEFDALRECGNVGIGNAATALSKLINKKVEINIPETKFVPITKFANEFGGPEKIVSGIYLEISEDLRGIIVCISRGKRKRAN
jgi:chemotaxis protein CheC